MILLKKILKSRILPWALIIALTAILSHSCSALKERENLLESTQEKVVLWRDDAGRSRAQVKVLKSGQKAFEIYHKTLVDSLQATIGTKKVSQVIYIDRVVQDTVELLRDDRGLIVYKDRWTSFFQPDKDRLSYQIFDSLTVVSYNKKHGFLNMKKTYVTEVINHNPYVSMTGLKSFEIEPRDRRVGLGVSVGYGATKTGLSPYVGFGVYYRVF